MRRVRIGRIHANPVSMEDAIRHVMRLAALRKGGYVVTPNVDHVVLADRSKPLQRAYDHSALSVVDGMPLLWLSKLFRTPLPEKISGSDLVDPLMRTAADNGSTVYLLGGAPGVAAEAADILSTRYPELVIVGFDSPMIDACRLSEVEAAAYDRLVSADPDLVLVALGCPKQELLMYRWNQMGCTSVMLGIGASLDFVTNRVSRSPVWLSRRGLEWTYRLLQDPKRLARRYLWQDLRFALIVYRMVFGSIDRLLSRRLKVVRSYLRLQANHPRR